MHAARAALAARAPCAHRRRTDSGHTEGRPKRWPPSCRRRDGTRRGNGVAPYFERLQPLREYVYARDDVESPHFEVRVFDDREDVGQGQPAIQVQFSAWDRGRRVSIFEAADLDELRELVTDLTGLLEELDG